MLLRTELEKLWKRPALWIGFAVSLLVGVFLTWSMLPMVYTGEGTISGLKAAAYNRRLAAEYEGYLTEEKTEAIISRFGFARYDEEGGCVYGNFLNRFVTEKMTDYSGDKRRAERLIPLSAKDGWLGACTYKDHIYFAYTEGWDELWEIFMGLAVVWGITLVVLLSPVYSSDRMLRTAPVIRASAEGRRRMVVARLAASWIVAAGGYLLIGGLFFLICGLIYGFEGLKANMLCLGAMPYIWPESVTVGAFWAGACLPRAVLGITVLVFFLSGISAYCGRTLTSVCLSALLFAFPVIRNMLWIRTFLTPLFSLLVNGMPFYMMIPLYEDGRKAFWILQAVVAMLFCLAGLWMVYSGWCRNRKEYGK